MNSITVTAPGWAAALSPTTTEDAWKVAQSLAKSQFVPKQFHGTPSDILIAAAMGARLGLDVFSALQSLAVVNGKPTLYGDAMLAVCQSRPDWRGMSVAWDGKADDETITVTVRRQVADIVSEYGGRFSVSDAKKAGLWTKQGPWSQFPKRMMEMRARSYALRGAFADALLGFHAKEEMEDAIDVSHEASVREDQPRRRMRTVTPGIQTQQDEQPTPAAVEPVDSAPADNATVPAAGGEPVVVEGLPEGEVIHQGQESTITRVAISSEPPTVDDVREAVVYAGRTVDGGVRRVVSELGTHLGYAVAKSEDVLTADRSKAIAFARMLAGV